MSKTLRDRLEVLSTETRRSKSFLGMEAIQHYVETEEEIILGIKRGLVDVKAGRVVPQDKAMKRIRATIDKVAKTKRSQ
jgi:predicted transcriptional regulator